MMGQDLPNNNLNNKTSSLLGFFRGLAAKFNFSQKVNLKSTRGSALIIAAMFMLIATFLITVGMKLVSNANRTSKESQLYVGEAQNAAKAGIEDTLGWFVRQNKIVTAFSNTPKA